MDHRRIQIERLLHRTCLSMHNDENYYYRFSCGWDAYRVQRVCGSQGMLRERRSKCELGLRQLGHTESRGRSKG